MAEHHEFTYAQIHKARFDAGLFADLPGAAEGVGDAYLATDTGVLYVCLATTAWSAFSTGGGAYKGLRWRLDAPISYVGDDTQDYITWDAGDWTYGVFGTPGALVLNPESAVFRYSFSIQLENSAAGRWHLQFFASDSNTAEDHYVDADGTGTPLELNFSGEFIPVDIQPDAGGTAYIYASQDSGSSMDVLAGSYVTISKIAVP